MVIINGTSCIEDLPVQSRINMQVDLGFIRREAPLIKFIIGPFTSGMSIDHGMQSMADSVRASVEDLLTHIDNTDDGSIQDYMLDTDLENCSDSISAMICSYMACCHLCHDLVEYIRADTTICDEVKQSYLSDCLKLNRALSLMGGSVMNLVTGQRYSVKSANDVRKVCSAIGDN